MGVPGFCPKEKAISMMDLIYQVKQELSEFPGEP
jgi:hypothetical protein